MKYIDADKLIAEIEKRLERYDPDYTNAGSELKELLSFIASLQQEQPEVDLEKEIEDWIGDEGSCKNGKWTFDECNRMIRHFYELGLNARKED